MKRLSFKLIALFLWMGIALNACDGAGDQPTRRTQFIMGTLVEITVSHSDTELVQSVTTQAFDEMKRIEQ